jgi:RHS repeat-associated protein
VIWRIEREPFGKIFKVRTGPDRHQPLAFPGQEDDGGETAYNVHRWYRPGWGRYTQADPIGVGGAGQFRGSSMTNGAHAGDLAAVLLYVYAGNAPGRNTDPSGLKLIWSNRSDTPLKRIQPGNVQKRAFDQLRYNPELREWFQGELRKRGKTLEDVLTGNVNVPVGIYSPGFGFLIGQAQTRWDGVFSGKWDGQPDRSVGLNASLFDPDYFDSDAEDERDAAETLIHELTHWVDAYADGVRSDVPADQKSEYYDFGAYMADKIKW